MDNKEIKKRLMLSSKGDLAERLIMAYATIKKLEERCLTSVEPSTIGVQQAHSNSGAG